VTGEGTIWLVRHAPTEWTGTRWTGARTDPPLSDAGREAATSLAAALAGSLAAGTQVLSSPSRRAIETARPIAAGLGAGIEIDDDLRETDIGELDGLTFDETRTRYPELARKLLAADPEVDWPGGELAADLRVRVSAAWERLAARAGDRPLIAVTHGGVISELIRVVLGDEIANAERWLDPGTAVALRGRNGDWRLGERIAMARP
jgi:ribonuclease H / adenosylcobalamin/alpha-ribazole phosphatase